MAAIFAAERAAQLLANIKLDNGALPIDIDDDLVDSALQHNLMTLETFKDLTRRREAAKTAPASKSKAKVDWSQATEVNPDTLPPALRAKYDDMKAAQRMAGEARTAFENAFNAAKPVAAGKARLFGHLWGKLNILTVDAVQAKSGKAKGQRSFDEL